MTRLEGSTSRKELLLAGLPLLVALLVVVSYRPVHSSSSCTQICTFCSSNSANCSSLRFATLPRIPSTVHLLNASGNELNLRHGGTWRHLQRLQILDVSRNRIRLTGLLHAMPDLRSLNLSHNLIRKLERPLTTLRKLRYVSIAHNRLENLGGELDGLHRLYELELQHNRIKKILRSSIGKLPQLKRLDLGSNIISHIDKRAFEHLARLHWLRLSGNAAPNLDLLEVPSTYFAYLDISNCSLHYVPLKLPATLEYLQLRGNRIKRLYRDSFRTQGESLAILVLDQNELQEVEAGTFYPLKSLRQLWLSDNRLRAIPVDLPDSLERLLLHNNSIKRLLAYGMHALHNLRDLDLSQNRLVHLHPRIFSGLNSLQTLVLDRNKLQFVHVSSLSQLPALRVLSMSRMTGKTFRVESQKEFTSLTRLAELYASESPTFAQYLNRHASLLAAGMTALSTLDLHHCDLKSVSPDLESAIKHVNHVNLGSEKWHCDRSILPLRRWLVQNSRRGLCRTPPTLRNAEITSLRPEKLKPPNRTRQHHPTELFPSVPDVTTTAIVTTVTDSETTATSMIQLTTISALSSQANDSIAASHSKSSDRHWNALSSQNETSAVTKFTIISAGGEWPTTDEPIRMDGARNAIQLTALLLISAIFIAVISTAIYILARKQRRKGQEEDATEAPTATEKKAAAVTEAAAASIQIVPNDQKNAKKAEIKGKKAEKNKNEIAGRKAERNREIKTQAQLGDLEKDKYVRQKNGKHSIFHRRKDSEKEKLSLVSGRDITQDGPRRIYKWEEF